MGAAAIVLLCGSVPPGTAGVHARARSTADAELRVFLPFVSQPPPATRYPSDLHAARARYPSIVGTELNHCRLCHVMDERFQMNPYGRDYLQSRRDFAAVEPLDSDGDGFSNIDEIRALTFPGGPASHPPAAP